MLAIFLSESAPFASLVIYASVPILYVIGIVVVRKTAPAGSAERDFT